MTTLKLIPKLHAEQPRRVRDLDEVTGPGGDLVDEHGRPLVGQVLDVQP
jgi:hypothetical protein